MRGHDARFGGSSPKLYEQLLVPMIFEPYAENLARQAAAISPARVLEIAAGTGVVTRKLASMLPAGTSIVATDLNPPMLEAGMAPRWRLPRVCTNQWELRNRPPRATPSSTLPAAAAPCVTV